MRIKTLFQRKPRPAKERQSVLYWLSQGKRTPEIALILSMSERKVRRIMDELRDQMDAREDTLLVRRGFETKMLQTELRL